MFERGDDRLGRRQRLSRGLACFGLDLRHCGFRLGEAPTHREPPRGLRQQAAQHQGQKAGQGADREHVRPAEMRHDPKPGEARGYQADRKYELVKKNEAATALRPGQFADKYGGDRNLAAEPDPLHRPERQQRIVIPGQRADEAHHREERDRPDHRCYSSMPLRDPAEHQRTEQLPEEARRDQPSDLLRRQLPKRRNDRQHRSDRERIEGIEEGGSADDDPCLDLPPGRGQALDSRNDSVDR